MKSIPKVLQRYAKRIQDVSDERDSQNGYWVYFQPGWISLDGTHQLHEDNPTQCARKMSIVIRCDCPECKELAAEALEVKAK